MSTVRVLGAILVAAFAITTAWPALGQSSDDHQRAAELKREGDADLSEKLYVEALDAYDRSYALEPSPVLLYNRGRTLQFLGRYAESVDALKQFRAQASPDLRSKAEGIDDVIASLRVKVATVSVACAVPGARVLIGDDMGTVSNQPFRVNAGRAVVEVIADGYFPFRKEMELPGAAKTEVDAQLASTNTFGLLVVRSGVASSQVYVDGRHLGVAPAEATLAPGQHPVRVEHDGYSPAQTQVVLGVGERKELVLNPLRPKPLIAKWWFWTGLGVIVTGIAVTVTVVALLTERSPPNGDFSPGQVPF